jgi:putative endonuclease
MFSVYILYSPSSSKTYVGFTNNLSRRLNEHNFTETKGFTLKYRPWVNIYEEVFELKSEAMKKEKYFKSGLGREDIKLKVSIYLKNK